MKNVGGTTSMSGTSTYSPRNRAGSSPAPPGAVGASETSSPQRVDTVADVQRFVAVEILAKRAHIVCGEDEQREQQARGQPACGLQREERPGGVTGARRACAADEGAKTDADEVQRQQCAEREGR